MAVWEANSTVSIESVQDLTRLAETIGESMINRWIENTQVPKSVDLARCRTLAIFNSLIAHDTEKEDLRFFDVDLAH